MRSTTTPPLIFLTSVPAGYRLVGFVGDADLLPDPHEIGLLFGEDD
jgi:hypothetical protein